MSDHHSHRGHGDGTMAAHGMALLGGEVLYLSHVPMFASPHNLQGAAGGGVLTGAA